MKCLSSAGRSLPIAALVTLCSVTMAVCFTGSDYREAGWLTLRFFGAQRCGSTGNWTLVGHDAAKGGEVCHTRDGQTAGVDLAGGWHDCGDHWKVCFTMGFSAYTLLKAYDVFPRGFTDRYRQRYTYSETMPAADGDGIPDPINEAKVATDYFIKAIPDAGTFYAECGDPNLDHKEWRTSACQSLQAVDKGGDPRPVVKRTSGAGASCAQYVAALAVMARLAPRFGMSAYADSCRAAAIRGYEYAKRNASSPYANGGFYSESSESSDDLIVAASELFFLTGTAQYKTDALGYIAGKWESGWAYSWNSLWEAAYYNLLKIDYNVTNGSGKSVLALFKGSYTTGMAKKNSAGLAFYNDWGSCRYAGGLAFGMMLLYDIQKDKDAAYAAQALALARSQVDYCMGTNEFNRSFIHGFGANSWDKVHHRNLQGLDDNPADPVKESTPFKFRRSGALIGGPSGVNQFTNSVVTYQNTESGCDYNAGITGALAGIICVDAPYEPIASGARGAGGCGAAEAGRPGLMMDVSVTRNGAGARFQVAYALSRPGTVELLVVDARGVLAGYRTGLTLYGGRQSLTLDAPVARPGLYLCAIASEDGRTARLVMVR